MNRDIVTSYKKFENVKNKYPTRNIIADRWCGDSDVYILRAGKRGVLSLKEDGSVWAAWQFPHFFKVWPSKNRKQFWQTRCKWLKGEF